MSESSLGIDWQPRRDGFDRLPGLRDDPGRIVYLIAGALLLAGAFLPWAEGKDPVGHPATYTAQQGLAEGFILLVLAIMLIVFGVSRVLVESKSRTVQLLPLALAVVAATMWLGADRASLQQINDWTVLGGSGHQTWIKLVTGLGIVLILVGVVWLEFTRPREIKAATRGLRVEWHVSRVNAVEGVVAAVFAIVFAAIAGVATIFVLGPDGSFFAVFSTLLGMAVGISLGLGLTRWIRGGDDNGSTEPSKTRRNVEVAKVVRKRS